MSRLLFGIAFTIELVIMLIEGSDLILPFDGLLFRVTFVLFLLSALAGMAERAGRTLSGGKETGNRGKRPAADLLRQITGLDRTGTLLFAAGLVLFAVSFFVTGRNELIRILVFVFACMQMDTEKVCRYWLYLTAAGSLVIVLLSAAGIFGIQYLNRDFGHGMELRWCLGFGHPNALHCMALMVLILFLYIYGASCGWYLYACLTAANILLYVLTRSNTGFATGMAAILLYALARLRSGGRVRKGWYIAAEAAFAAELVFSFLAAAWGYALPGMAKLDRLLTGRVASLYETKRNEGTVQTWSLFSAPRNVYYFDMGWVRLFYWYGVIPALFCILVIFLLFRRMRRKRDIAGTVMLLCLCTYTMAEAHLISVFILRDLILLLVSRYAGSGKEPIESEN